ETQIKKFLEKHGEQSELLPVHSNLGRSGQETILNSKYSQEIHETRRIFPEIGNDGFFVALIRRIE
ncbi:MAG: hypothetical protein ACW99F_12875, partial [Candidatus Hodarchaeales archaeon]